MKIKVYAHMSPESLYERGREAGLLGDALNFFRYFEEVELNLEVDETTGLVLGCEVGGEFSK